MNSFDRESFSQVLEDYDNLKYWEVMKNSCSIHLTIFKANKGKVEQILVVQHSSSEKPFDTAIAEYLTTNQNEKTNDHYIKERLCNAASEQVGFRDVKSLKYQKLEYYHGYVPLETFA